MEKHYICLGGCKGVSKVPGVCQVENCVNHNHNLVECNCVDALHGGFKKKTNIHKKVFFSILLILLLLAGLTYGAIKYGLISFFNESTNQENSNESRKNSDDIVSKDYTASGQFFDMTSGTPVPTKATLKFNHTGLCYGDCSMMLPAFETKEVTTDDNGRFEVVLPVTFDTIPSVYVDGYIRIKINEKQCSPACNIPIRNNKVEMSVFGMVKNVVESNPVNIKVVYNQKIDGIWQEASTEYLDYSAFYFRCIGSRPCGYEEVKGIIHFLRDGTHSDTTVSRRNFKLAPSYPHIPKSMECIFEYDNVKRTGCNIDLSVIPDNIRDIKVTVNSEF